MSATFPADDSQLGEQELHTGIPGQRGNIAFLAGDPLGDIGGPAIGDKAEPVLPSAQIAITLGVHQTHDRCDADSARQQDAACQRRKTPVPPPDGLCLCRIQA